MFTKKILIFGAGKIGRSFIGQLFGREGYKLVFVDIDRVLINLLNHHRHYRVVFKSDGGDEEFLIEGVRGIHLGDTDAIINELADTSLAAVSVGQQGLSKLLPIFARAMTTRMKRYDLFPLDIMIAENMRDAGLFFKERLVKLLPGNFPIEAMVGLIETSIGKMVPVMTNENLAKDPLLIYAEPYNTLIVDKHGFKNPIPQIGSLAPKDNIKAWVDCKLFIHNLGHSAVAYFGHIAMPDTIYVAQLLNNSDLFEKTKTTMLQSAALLLKLYPGEFTVSGLSEHIDDLIMRFGNHKLCDTVFRVGCDLYRKLGLNDRFAVPLKTALNLNMPHNHILKAMKIALLFRAKDQNSRYLPSDVRFFAEAKKGIEHILQHVSGFTYDEIRELLDKSDIINDSSR